MTTPTSHKIHPCKHGCPREDLVIRGRRHGACWRCGSLFTVEQGAYSPVTKGARVAL